MGTTRQLRIEDAGQRLGQAEVVSRCLDLLAGGTEDPDFIVTLGGPQLPLPSEVAELGSDFSVVR